MTGHLEEREIAAVPNVFNSFRLLDSICNSDFYVHLFINGFMNHQLYRLINAGVRNDGLLNLYNDDFYGCLLPVPPLTEQQKIAVILNHCDKVIELKRELIEEERKRKKWLMQNLLDPDSGVRLQGFESSWTITRVKDMGIIVTGTTPPTEKKEYYEDGLYPWVTPTDINRKYTTLTERSLSSSGLVKGRTLPEKTLLVTCIASIGKNTILMKKGSCNQQINAIIPFSNHDVEFLYYMMENSKNYFMKYAGTTATPIISMKGFSNMKFLLPSSIEEQIAIATVIAAQDVKIDLLEQELSQWQQKKKALMQLLLTGIVRVSV